MVKGCPCVKRDGRCAPRKAGKAGKHRKAGHKKACKSGGIVIPCACKKLRGEERRGCIMAGVKSQEFRGRLKYGKNIAKQNIANANMEK